MIRSVVLLLTAGWTAVGQYNAQSCVCPGGNVLRPGMIRFSRGSDRTEILSVDRAPQGECKAATLFQASIQVTGGTYSIHIRRFGNSRIELRPCALPRFVEGEYRFDPGNHALLTPASPAAPGRVELLTADRLLEELEVLASPLRSAVDPETAATSKFTRHKYLVARNRVRANIVLIDDRKLLWRGPERLVKAGEICQVELAEGQLGPFAALRCYAKNPPAALFPLTLLRAWTDANGGPYTVGESGQFRDARAYIVAALPEEFEEINDYFDRTGKTIYP